MVVSTDSPGPVDRATTGLGVAAIPTRSNTMVLPTGTDLPRTSLKPRVICLPPSLRAGLKRPPRRPRMGRGFAGYRTMPAISVKKLWGCPAGSSAVRSWPSGHALVRFVASIRGGDAVLPGAPGTRDDQADDLVPSVAAIGTDGGEPKSSENQMADKIDQRRLDQPFAVEAASRCGWSAQIRSLR